MHLLFFLWCVGVLCCFAVSCGFVYCVSVLFDFVFVLLFWGWLRICSMSFCLACLVGVVLAFALRRATLCAVCCCVLLKCVVLFFCLLKVFFCLVEMRLVVLFCAFVVVLCCFCFCWFVLQWHAMCVFLCVCCSSCLLLFVDVCGVVVFCVVVLPVNRLCAMLVCVN